MVSIDDVTSFICEQEQALDLFSITNQGIHVWPFLRVRVCVKLEQMLGIISQPHDKSKKLSRLESYSKAFFYDTKAKLYHKRHDTIIVPHYRKQMINQEAIDIYTHYIEASTTDYILVERYDKSNIKTKNKGLIVLKESALDLYQHHIKRAIGDCHEIQAFDELTNRIRDKFHIDYDIQREYMSQWSHFIRGYHRFKAVLQRIKPKQVIIVVAYDKYDIVAACKACNIKVIEVQHGIIDQHHLGYHYPNTIPSACFVDELWLFHEYWQKAASLPLTKENIKLIGFTYFREQSKQIQALREEHRVLVLSQGTSGTHMVSEVLALARAHPHLQVDYKLHPGEFNQWKERYPDLLECPSNVRVYTNELPIYQLMKQAKFCIGAYSTAIYEALALGCVGILIDIPGTQTYMKYLIEHELVYLSSNLVEDWKEIAENASNRSSENQYF